MLGARIESENNVKSMEMDARYDGSSMSLCTGVI